jgi:hypothetical protein
MVDRKVVPFDEFYYQLKLMHLFLLHPVFGNCLLFLEIAFEVTVQLYLILEVFSFQGNLHCRQCMMCCLCKQQNCRRRQTLSL